MAGEFRVQHVATVPRGYKVRTVTRARHRVRIAFPPGRRVKGSGTVVEVLHPRNENPCPVKNPAELVLMAANPSWQIVVRSKSSHKGEEVWPATFKTRSAAKEYAYSKFTEGSVLRYERIKNPAELVLMSANPSQLESASELYQDFHGRPSEHIDEYQEPSPRSVTLTELGDLVELRTKSGAGWKHRALEFRGCGVKLAANPAGTQLYFVGGNQGLRALSPFGADRSKELVDLGDAVYIAYRAKKSQVNGIASDYEHYFGEVSGQFPRLMYDRSAGEPRLKLSGGAYSVRPEGIVN